MAGNRVVNFHGPRSEERLAEPWRATGRLSTDPTTGREKGALMQTLRVCVRSPRGGAALAPADGVPRPPRGGGAGGTSRPPTPSPATLAGGSQAAATSASLSRPAASPMATTEKGRSPLGSPLPWGMAGEPGAAWALRRLQGGRVPAQGAARPRLWAAPPPLTPPPRWRACPLRWG